MVVVMVEDLGREPDAGIGLLRHPPVVLGLGAAAEAPDLEVFGYDGVLGPLLENHLRHFEERVETLFDGSVEEVAILVDPGAGPEAESTAEVPKNSRALRSSSAGSSASSTLKAAFEIAGLEDLPAPNSQPSPASILTPESSSNSCRELSMRLRWALCRIGSIAQAEVVAHDESLRLRHDLVAELTDPVDLDPDDVADLEAGPRGGLDSSTDPGRGSGRDPRRPARA